MTAKHTPGDWWADHRGDVIAMPSQVRVAAAHGSTPEERKANARLIAAAPCLLEALRAFEQGPPDGDDPAQWFAQYALNLEHARAAIQKAEGQA